MSVRKKYRGYSALGLYNIKDDNNLGSVLRNAGCFGANLVLVHGDRLKHGRIGRTDTRNTHKSLPVIFTLNILDNIPYEAKVVAVEISDKAENLGTFVHPNNCLYLFGPEDGSLPQEILDVADYTVYIPTDRCLNLATASGIVLYDRIIKQQKDNDEHNEREMV